MKNNLKKKVAIVYTHLPHYRTPVFEELLNSEKSSFKIFCDKNGVDSTILSGSLSGNIEYVRTYKIMGFMFQPGLLWTIIFADFDAYIFLGNPYILTNWFYAGILRIIGKRVIFWTHGWINENKSKKETLRNIYYRMAHNLFLYGDRAKAIGISKGFAADSMYVIYNSIDYERQKLMRSRYYGFEGSKKLFFLCVSRLIPEVDLKTAISAIKVLKNKISYSVDLVVIGSGPERNALEEFAREVSVNVEFKGAIYEEEELSKFFMTSVAVVSPGKVGLLAMHALAYGVPVITHGDMNRQMPEVEAIIPGKTGSFFKYGSVDALAKEMEYWLYCERRKQVMIDSINIIENRYTPKRQRIFIENAISNILAR